MKRLPAARAGESDVQNSSARNHPSDGGPAAPFTIAPYPRGGAVSAVALLSGVMSILAEMSGLPIYCSDYHCSHWTAISGDPPSRQSIGRRAAIALAGVHLRGGGCTKNPTLLLRSAKRRSAPFQRLLLLVLIAYSSLNSRAFQFALGSRPLFLIFNR
jgi:hypothetical protein